MVGLSAIRSLNSSSITRSSLFIGAQPVCLCSACQSARSNGHKSSHHSKSIHFNYVQQNTPQNAQPQQTQGTSSDDSVDEGAQEEEKIDPVIHRLIPDASYVKNNLEMQTILRDKLPFINNPKPQPCISPNARLINPSDKSLREVITEIDKDIKEAKVNHQQLIFARDDTYHSFIEIVNRTGTPLTLSQAIELITKDRKGNEGFPNTYVDGVIFHEINHAAYLEMIPDIVMEKFEQGVRIVITGTTEEPEFEVTTFGQTVFYADKIYEKTDQNEQQFMDAQARFNQAQGQGFRGWTDNSFAQLINGLKQNINNLQFLAKEAYMLAMAAIAPLSLEGTPYYEHAVLSAADEKRYAEAIQLKDQIDKLIGNIQAFISRAVDIWNGVRGSGSPAAQNNVVPFPQQASRQAQKINSVG
ncbi:MAG: hypothetical protein SFU25_06690 [Candidatus Caenarcaniphilales bacterium]|nr:hypothetical protein [Candidatus Caenarcaniphilales bacterium]